MKYKAISVFNKDFKKLLKRYKTLNEDFNRLKKISIELYHSGLADICLSLK